MKPVIIIALAFVFLFVPLTSFAEEYYYFDEILLVSPPVFCAMEFEDTQLPNAQSQLMEITKNAVLDWESKLVEATNNQEGWDFKLIIFSVEEQQELFFDSDCTVNIYFEREPIFDEDLGYAGYTEAYLFFSDIRIFYLEPVFEFKGKIIEVDGELWEELEITGFKNILDEDLHHIIRHEIGHSLGLDHPKFESKDFVKESFSVLNSPSIMLDDSDWDITVELRFEITDYDIRSVVNLYGEDGINEFDYLSLIDYAVVIVIFLIIAYLINRKFRKKDSKLIPLDDD